jgi:hypothetical protein
MEEARLSAVDCRVVMSLAASIEHAWMLFIQ